MAEKEAAPTGHQPRGNAPQRTPEQEKLSNRIQEHQRGAARLSKTEEVRACGSSSLCYILVLLIRWMPYSYSNDM
jgi:hypothetical protein